MPASRHRRIPGTTPRAGRRLAPAPSLAILSHYAAVVVVVLFAGWS